jgi:hypothetical protein
MPDRLRTRATLVAIILAAYLTIQVIVPVAALFGPRPARFGWQMYSALPDLPQAWTVAADGTEEEIALASLFAIQRAEIDYTAVLRSGLCDVTDAPAVKVQAPDAQEPELIECR